MAEVIIGFDNLDDTEFLIMTMSAAFHYPQDFNQILQNVRLSFKFAFSLSNPLFCPQFTTYKYEVSVKPGEQASLSYRWYIPPVFETREFGLTVLVTFSNEVRHLRCLTPVADPARSIGAAGVPHRRLQRHDQRCRSPRHRRLPGVRLFRAACWPVCAHDDARSFFLFVMSVGILAAVAYVVYTNYVAKVRRPLQ